MDIGLVMQWNYPLGEIRETYHSERLKNGRARELVQRAGERGFVVDGKYSLTNLGLGRVLLTASVDWRKWR
jgi:hypothetical protein